MENVILFEKKTNFFLKICLKEKQDGNVSSRRYI